MHFLKKTNYENLVYVWGNWFVNFYYFNFLKFLGAKAYDFGCSFAKIWRSIFFNFLIFESQIVSFAKPLSIFFVFKYVMIVMRNDRFYLYL